jgi:hypothetical protein
MSMPEFKKMLPPDMLEQLGSGVFHMATWTAHQIGKLGRQLSQLRAQDLIVSRSERAIRCSAGVEIELAGFGKTCEFVRSQFARALPIIPRGLPFVWDGFAIGLEGNPCFVIE